MGSCYYLNALGSSYLIHIRHMRHWYMCLVYYSLDVILVKIYIFYKAVSRMKTSQKYYRIEIIKILVVCGIMARG